MNAIRLAAALPLLAILSVPAFASADAPASFPAPAIAPPQPATAKDSKSTARKRFREAMTTPLPVT